MMIIVFRKVKKEQKTHSHLEGIRSWTFNWQCARVERAHIKRARRSALSGCVLVVVRCGRRRRRGLGKVLLCRHSRCGSVGVRGCSVAGEGRCFQRRLEVVCSHPFKRGCPNNRLLVMLLLLPFMSLKRRAWRKLVLLKRVRRARRMDC
jgi:hypothetical protein